MYVILDYHASSGSALERGPTMTAGAFAAKWAALWKAVTCTRRWAEDGAGRVVADILNEPDMLGLT
jgi:aryl-phospho-beta-D-glucosidase BglC (GH1 family)